MTQTYTFVGGPLDSEKIAVPGGPTFFEQADPNSDFVVHVYKRAPGATYMHTGARGGSGVPLTEKQLLELQKPKKQAKLKQAQPTAEALDDLFNAD